MEPSMIFTHEINHNPEAEDVGTLRISVTINKFVQSINLEDYEFYEDRVTEIRRIPISYRLDIALIFIETLSGPGDIPFIDSQEAYVDFRRLINEVTSSDEYAPNCCLRVRAILNVFRQILDFSDDDMEMEESSDTSSLELRPACKLAVESLNREIYKVKSESEMCTVCLEEFEDGIEIVILLCGHEFHDECIEEWFLRSHACPLCRFELPYEDEDYEYEECEVD